MPVDIARANRVARIFGDRSFQLNFKTFTLQMRSGAVITASYPRMIPSVTTPNNFKVFNEAVMLISCYLSTTFHATGIAETACVAIGRKNTGNNIISLLGDSDVFLQQTLDATAATPPGTEIHRNVGISFSSPFFPLLQVDQAITIFGTNQTVAGLSYYTTATIYYMRAQEIAEFMELANG